MYVRSALFIVMARILPILIDGCTKKADADARSNATVVKNIISISVASLVDSKSTQRPYNALFAVVCNEVRTKHLTCSCHTTVCGMWP